MKELSIVIPALNEENFIGLLLNDILNNTYKDYEVIVSDSGSEDKTKEVVESFAGKGIKFVSAGRGAATARNDGAKHATGEYVLFLDADQRIPEDFIEKSMAEMKRRNIDIGGCYSKPTGSKVIDKVFWWVCNNLLFRPGQYICPGASTGSGLLIKKSIHEKINGFDEGIHVTHDHDYVERASKAGRFRMLKSVRSNFNMRRFEKEGRVNLYLKYIALLLLHLGHSKKTPFKYEFGRH